MASRMAKKLERCIFCRRSDMSREHVWADWLRNHIPKNAPSYSSLSAIAYPTHTEFKRSKISGDIQNRKLRVVCERHCNNGWMSRLQEQAKPYLLPLTLGQVTAMDVATQGIVAAWIAMTVTVAEYFDPSKAAVSYTQRRYLCKNQAVPPNWKIWIGHYVRGNWPAYLVHNPLPISSAQHRIKRLGTGLPRPNTQTTAFVVGQFYIFAASSDTDIFDRWQVPGEGAKLAQIWPIRRNIVAWPTETLSDRGADQIAGSFFLAVEETGGRNRLPKI
jgi:hypothetical protein